MRPIDADTLVKRYEQKAIEHGDNRNVQILLKTLMDSVSAEPTINVPPDIQPVGVVSEHSNGMVSMRKETYLEYNRVAVECLPKKHDGSVLAPDDDENKPKKNKRLFRKKNKE